MPTPVLCPNPLCRHLLCERDGALHVLRVRTRNGSGPKRVVVGQFQRIRCEKCERWYDLAEQKALAA